MTGLTARAARGRRRRRRARPAPRARLRRAARGRAGRACYDARPRRAPRRWPARHGCRAFDARPRRCCARWTRSRWRCRRWTTTRVARALLEAGKDVLVEKPMTADAGGGGRPDRAWPRRAGRVLQVGHVERFNPAVDVLRGAGRRAAVHRGPPAGLVLAAQPRHRRGAGPDDPRPRHRPGPGRVGGRAGRRGRRARADPARRHRQRPAALRLRPDRQPDRQPGLGRAGAQVPRVRAPDLRLGRPGRRGRRRSTG